jgi:hypothetical protein
MGEVAWLCRWDYSSQHLSQLLELTKKSIRSNRLVFRSALEGREVRADEEKMKLERGMSVSIKGLKVHAVFENGSVALHIRRK